MVGDVEDRRVRPYTGDRGGRRVHRVDRAGEVADQQMAQHRLPDALGLPARTDHRHRAGEEQPLDRARLGPVLTGGLYLSGRRGRRQVQGELDDAVLEVLLGLVPDVPEDLGHLPVVGQHAGHEPAQPAFPCGGGHVFEQDAAQAPALVGVLHQEGDLGLAVPDPVIARHRHHLVADRGDQGHPVLVVDGGEVLDLTLGQSGMRREEPVVDGLRRQPGVEGAQQLGVAGLDGPPVGRPTVGQYDVRLPMVRIGPVPSLWHPLVTSRSSPETASVPGFAARSRPHGLAGTVTVGTRPGVDAGPC